MDIERLVNRHKDAVYRQMVRTCGNHADAEDALAEALFAAVKSSSTLQSPDHFQAWLAKIGSRACARMRIKERLMQLSSINELEESGFQLADEHQGPAAAVEDTELKHCVKQAVDDLPDIYREVYLRREIQGEPAESVAQSMGITVASVKSRLHRARTAVRHSLDQNVGCDGLARS